MGRLDNIADVDVSAVDVTKMGEAFRIMGVAISGFIKEGALKGGWIDSLITNLAGRRIGCGSCDPI